MNILYLHTHDSGRLLGPYGYPVSTPNLDRLADDAAVFRNCFCVSPTCSPSRAAMLSGTYPHQCGMLGLAQRGFSMDYSQHLVHYLKENGYHTVLCGIQHESGWYLDRKQGADAIGYDEELTLDPGEYRQEDLVFWDRKNSEQAEQWLDAWDGSKPFFLSYGMYATHRRFPDTIDPSIQVDRIRVPQPIPDSPETRADYAGYLTSAMSADSCVGRLLDKLKEKNLYDDTVILFTTDHGIANPYCKCTLFDSGIGVALILRVPGKKANGHMAEGLVSHLDVFPTLCDAVGLSKPDWLEGRSLMPMLDDPSQRVRQEVFAEVNFHTSYEPIRCIRTERYKYIRYFDSSYLGINQSNIDDSPTKEYFLERGLAQQKKWSEALYDLVYDPGERNNLANAPAYQQIRQELSEKLEAEMRRTKDALLDGEISVRPEWKVNKKECVHASSKVAEDYVSLGVCGGRG